MAEARQPARSMAGDHANALLAAASRSSFLGALGRSDLEAVLDRCRVVQTHRDHVLLRGREDSALFLLRGAALARSATADGDEAVVALLDPGASWGLVATLGRPDDVADIDALTSSAGLVISGTDLRDLVSARPGVARAALRVVVSELATARADAVRLSNASATERVVHRIVELCERWGRVTDGHVEVTIPLTQDDLASWARTSRESAAKALQELRRAEVIRTGRRELVVLDPERLSARVQPPASRRSPVQELLGSVG